MMNYHTTINSMHFSNEVIHEILSEIYVHTFKGNVSQVRKK